MSDDQQPGRLVVAGWTTSDDDLDELRRLVAEVAGLPAALVDVVHACRSCGSDRHGQLHVVLPVGGPALHVSLSRSAGTTLVGVSDAGAIGIDVEAVSGAADAEDLAAWVRAESLVKATGHGLTIDPAVLDDVVRHTIDLAVPGGFVAAATVLTDLPPLVVVTPRAAPGA